MTKLVIVGGGIAGLSAAYYARKKNPDAEITLLESSDCWGGKITTQRVAFDDGQFIIEGGPDTFLATKPWGVALCKELGLADRLHGTNPHKKNTYVLNRDRLLPLPDGLAMMIPTNIEAILRSRLVSWFSKARMGLDFLLPAKAVNGDESLGAFVSRRLGREAYENLIEPLMSGIYAGDGDALSLASTFPYLRDLELKYGSLARGALKMRQQSNGKSVQGSRSAFLTPTTGLAEIVEKLVEYLTANDVTLRLNTRVVSIHQPTPETWHPSTLPSVAGRRLTLDTGDMLAADGIVIAAPAFAAAQMLASLDPQLASDLQNIPYVSTATVSLAYRQSDIPRELDGYGYVIPRREGRRALACTWTSTKFPHRAPEGYALLRIFVGRAGQDIPWNENDLLALAKEELSLTLGITADPLLSRVFLWEKAMPQYNLGHPEILERIDAALEKYPGLALAGNGYRGIGIPDCIHSGEVAVEKILKHEGHKETQRSSLGVP
ncbi:MAG TPA: protoporphyrinogen oxidase [Anaerolineales bacterium]|nr:protoporphyrinogen oxidase [Anaerolineales bacterium]